MWFSHTVYRFAVIRIPFAEPLLFILFSCYLPRDCADLFDLSAIGCLLYVRSMSLKSLSVTLTLPFRNSIFRITLEQMTWIVAGHVAIMHKVCQPICQRICKVTKTVKLVWWMCDLCARQMVHIYYTSFCAFVSSHFHTHTKIDFNRYHRTLAFKFYLAMERLVHLQTTRWLNERK